MKAPEVEKKLFKQLKKKSKKLIASENELDRLKGSGMLEVLIGWERFIPYKEEKRKKKNERAANNKR